MISSSNPWLFGRRTDLLALFLPVWLCWLASFLLPDRIIYQEIGLWIWVVFVIGFDVSHVWGTLFRTYFNKEDFHNHKRLLVIAPILALVAAAAISSMSFDLFWRCLAYVAVWHFVKQQYGFMRLYKARARDFKKKWFKDNLIINFSMLYPILYWHLNLDRNFEWFTEGDFINFLPSLILPEWVFQIGNVFYVLVMLAWLVEELVVTRKTGSNISYGKILWVLTTAGNWSIGIVWFNSDFVFTITNVVAHGMPYLCLIIVYKIRFDRLQKQLSTVNIWRIASLVLVSVMVFALIEEYAWDIFVYRENASFFSSFLPYPFQSIPQPVKVGGLAILSMPQITHYIVDGYIWKVNDRNPHLKQILLG